LWPIEEGGYGGRPLRLPGMGGGGRRGAAPMARWRRRRERRREEEEGRVATWAERPNGPAGCLGREA
jgi:hypothetical protein